LRLLRQFLGVTVFSIDPYQVGHENEEGIESGAFLVFIASWVSVPSGQTDEIGAIRRTQDRG